MFGILTKKHLEAELYKIMEELANFVKKETAKPGYQFFRFNTNNVNTWMQQNPTAASMYQEIERVLNNLEARIANLERR